MQVVVLGGTGGMGRWTVRDLTESDGVDEVIVGKALYERRFSFAEACATAA